MEMEKNTEPVIAKTTQDHTVIIENLEEHKTLLSSIFLLRQLPLLTVTTLPWEIQKSHFSTVLLTHRDFRLLHYLRRNKLQLLYCSLSVYLLLFTTSYYLLSPILWSVFLSLQSVIFKATNANPQPALFRVTNIWRNATLSAVRCKSLHFTR